MLACAHRRDPLGGVRRLRPGSLATRIDDAKPTVIDGRPTPACAAAVQCPTSTCWTKAIKPGRAQARRRADGQPRPRQGDERGRRPRRGLRHPARQPTWTPTCRSPGSNRPSPATSCTSGTTGKPKGVQRDTGGYAGGAGRLDEAHIYCGNAGETFFSTSDIGWVVGHSYIIYGR